MSTGKHIGRLAKGRASDLENGFLHILWVVSPFAFGFFEHPVSPILCWFIVFLPQIVNGSHVLTGSYQLKPYHVSISVPCCLDTNGPI